MTSKPLHLSVWEKLDLFPVFIYISFVALYAATTSPFRGSNTPKAFKTHVILSVSRAAFSRLSVRQRQYLTGVTRSCYLAWIKRQSEFQPKILILKDGGTKVFWLGQPTAEHVVLYFHGGGWSMPANSGHFEFAAAILRKAETKGKSLSFAFVQYDLAPKTKYPSQMSQCVELLRYPLNTLAKEPSKVMLAGDSAGGNLVMGVISHLLHPHPDIDHIELTSPLKAAIVFSPWVNLDMKSGSVLENQMQDPVSPQIMRIWAQDYLGIAPLDYYNQPSITPYEWWRGIPVKHLLVTGAAREMLADDLIKFSEMMKTMHESTTVFFAADDFHAQPVIGREMYVGEGEQGAMIREWILTQV